MTLKAPDDTLPLHIRRQHGQPAVVWMKRKRKVCMECALVEEGDEQTNRERCVSTQ
jgi:hypothetical protein